MKIQRASLCSSQNPGCRPAKIDTKIPRYPIHPGFGKGPPTNGAVSGRRTGQIRGALRAESAGIDPSTDPAAAAARPVSINFRSTALDVVECGMPWAESPFSHPEQC